MSAVKNFIVFLLSWVGILVAGNIAIIADGTKSLYKYGILDKYKEGLKSIIELIAAIDPDNSVTFIKFGDFGESKIIYRGKITPDKLPSIFQKIEDEWNPNNLYKVRTSFYSGFAAALNQGIKYDLSVFITDGVHNSKSKDLEDLKKDYGHLLKNLGKVLIIHIKPHRMAISRGAEKIIEAWAKALNAEILYIDSVRLVHAFINAILKHRIKDFIVGYGDINSPEIRLTKYFEESLLHLIIYPAADVKGPGEIYKGHKISYVQVKNQAGELIYDLGKSFRQRFVFYYETVGYEPVLQIEPKRDFYFKGESISISVKFKTKDRFIDNDLFKNAMHYQLKINDKEFPINRLKDSEIISISLDDLGIWTLYMRYSPFPEDIKNLKYRKVYTFNVKKKAQLLKINFESEAGDKVYEHQLFKIKGEPLELNINNPVIRIESVDGNFVKVVNLEKEGEIFTAEVSLPYGTYKLEPLGNFKLGGKTVINVLPRKIVLEVYECAGNYKNCERNDDFTVQYETYASRLSFLLPVPTFIRESRQFYRVDIKVDPIFTDEVITYSVPQTLNKLSFNAEFENYPLFQILPISFGTKDGKIVIKPRILSAEEKLYIGLSLIAPNNVRLIDEIDPKKLLDNLGIQINEKSLGFYTLYMGITPIGSAEFYLYRTFIIVRNIVILLIILIVVLLILYYRKRRLLQKVGMVRLVARYRGDEFWDKIPSKVRDLLGNDKRNLKNVLSDANLAWKVAKAWSMSHLKEFLKRLTTPKENVETIIKLNNSVEIHGFVSDNWNEGVKQIFLRDEDLKGESFTIELKRDTLTGENMWTLRILASDFRTEDRKEPISGQTSIYKKRVEGSFGNYKFVLSMKGDEGVIRLYRKV